MARSPPRRASEEDWSDRRLRCAFSSREKTDASGISRVARCMQLHGLHGFHGLHGDLGCLAPPHFCANQKIPRKGCHRHIRQSANLSRYMNVRAGIPPHRSLNHCSWAYQRLWCYRNTQHVQSCTALTQRVQVDSSHMRIQNSVPSRVACVAPGDRILVFIVRVFVKMIQL